MDEVKKVQAYMVFDQVFLDRESAEKYLARSGIIKLIAADGDAWPTMWGADTFADYVLRHGESIYDILMPLYSIKPYNPDY
jgi:hypothetical protein